MDWRFQFFPPVAKIDALTTTRFIGISFLMPVFTTFYSIPIPEPVLKDCQQLAQLSTPEGIFAVSWMPKTEQVVIQHGNDWYIQPNGRIDESLSTLICCSTYDLYAGELFLFDRDYRNGKEAPLDMEQGLLGCEWSDYAHDKMVFQATIEVDGLEHDTFDFVE